MASKKAQVIEKIFQHCQETGKLEFDNALVKKVCAEVGFKNPFDATKFDNSSLLPPILQEHDYFIVHLGEGKHRFVQGIRNGYHRFETITDDEWFDWKYRHSVLNELDTSEANILSVAANQRILHDFLYDDIVASPKMYNAYRTKRTFSYAIGKQEVSVTNLHLEINYTFEYLGTVTAIKGQNGFPEDFAVCQLYRPFRYYAEVKRERDLPLRDVTCCYILHTHQQDGSSIIRLYNYTFDDENDTASIRLLKKFEYRLLKRVSAHPMMETSIVNTKNTKFSQ